jgi:two-component system chemotaxis response regulator CheY
MFVTAPSRLSSSESGNARREDEPTMPTFSATAPATYMNADLPPVRERILVVDDEPTIRSLVAQLLDDEGFEVARAGDGAEALRTIAENEPFDLIVLDMWMPVMNGWQFADALRQRHMAIRIVVMTAASEARARAAELGAIGYIGKPFDVDDLVRVVRDALPPHTAPSA